MHFEKSDTAELELLLQNKGDKDVAEVIHGPESDSTNPTPIQRLMAGLRSVSLRLPLGLLSPRDDVLWS